MVKYADWFVSVEQDVLKHRWSILYILLSLCEDPRKPSNRVPVCSWDVSLVFLQILHNNVVKKKFCVNFTLCVRQRFFFPLHRCVVMELCSPRLCPVMSTPPRSTTPVPRASRSATQSAQPLPITPAWLPVASAVWEHSRSMGLARPLRLCSLGEWQSVMDWLSECCFPYSDHGPSSKIRSAIKVTYITCCTNLGVSNARIHLSCDCEN